jgi:hypothetical protein
MGALSLNARDWTIFYGRFGGIIIGRMSRLTADASPRDLYERAILHHGGLECACTEKNSSYIQNKTMRIRIKCTRTANECSRTRIKYTRTEKKCN